MTDARKLRQRLAVVTVVVFPAMRDRVRKLKEARPVSRTTGRRRWCQPRRSSPRDIIDRVEEIANSEES